MVTRRYNDTSATIDNFHNRRDEDYTEEQIRRARRYTLEDYKRAYEALYPKPQSSNGADS